MSNILFLFGMWPNRRVVIVIFKTINYYVFSLVSSVVIFCAAQSQVDVDKLFHANPPPLAPNRPVNTPRPLPAISELFDDELKPYRGSRHDEFDWALTKVFK